MSNRTAKRLNQAIYDRGMSMQEAADFLGIPLTTLRDWAKGHQPKVMVAMGAILKLEPNWRKRCLKAEARVKELESYIEAIQLH